MLLKGRRRAKLGLDSVQNLKSLGSIQASSDGPLTSNKASKHHIEPNEYEKTCEKLLESVHGLPKWYW
jgi:hypothetical protein